MTGREPTSASFEPQRLGGGPRRTDPLLLVVAVVIVGLGLAVLKPWAAAGPGTTAGQASEPSGTSPPTAGASSEPQPDTAATPRPPTVPAVLWRQVAPVVARRDAWGVRAIVRVPGDGELSERWSAATPDDDPTVAARPTVLETPDQGVLALGITFPPDELPLDLRVHAAADDGAWAWAGAAPLDPAPAFGGFLLGPPVIRGQAFETWPAGRYRIDVLTGQGIRSMHVGLPDRFEVVPGPDGPAALTDETLRSPFAPRFPEDIEPGAFLVAGGVVERIHADGLDATLDAAATWRDGVPSLHAPDATGLGVLMPSGSSEGSATLQRLAPLDESAGGRRAIGVRLAADRAPFVIFRAPGGAAWAPGTYRIDATWTEPGGDQRAASYHLELLPAPGMLPGLVLDATRAFRDWAGRVDGLVGMPSYPADEEQDLSCLEGEEAVITNTPTVIGLGHPPGAPPSSVRGELQFDGGRLAEQPVLVAPEALPGLTIVAPATTDSFAPGLYRLTVADADGPRTLVLCAGVIIID